MTTRWLIQYVEPFSTVRVSIMAEAFGQSEKEMLERLESLIFNGKLKARLDIVDNVSCGSTTCGPDTRFSLSPHLKLDPS